MNRKMSKFMLLNLRSIGDSDRHLDIIGYYNPVYTNMREALRIHVVSIKEFKPSCDAFFREIID